MISSLRHTDVGNRVSESVGRAVKHIGIAAMALFVPQFTFAQSTCLPDTSNDQGFAAIGDTAISEVTNDGDNTDGVGDGALLFNGQSAAAGQGGAYLFSCLMAAGESLSISSYVYNPRSSFVRLRVALHNVSDDVELATTAATTLNTRNPVHNFTLSYVTQSTDEGDELELRYIRTDDGNTARDFAIDNASINGQSLQIKKAPPPPNPACSAPLVFDTDIPLEAATYEQIAEIDRVYETLSDIYIGTADTVDTIELLTLVDQALLDYDALDIVVTGERISGNTITFGESGQILKAFAQYLKLIDSSDNDIAEKASNLVWLMSQKLCDLEIPRNRNAYGYREFARHTIHLKDYLSDEIKDRFGYTLSVHSEGFLNFWGDWEAGFGYNTDWIFNISDTIVLFGLWKTSTTDDERVQWMKAAKRYLERFLTYSDGTSDGIKPDGTGFHHWVAYDGYMYAWITLTDILSALDDTSFQIDADSYIRLRDSMYAQRMMSNDAGVIPLSMTGRNPGIKTRSTEQETLRRLAITGGKILGLTTADPILAGYYNRAWGVEPEFNYDETARFENGFFQLNHGNAGVLRKRSRRGDWLAFFKGFSDNMWGAELYVRENRYGRYQSYGAVEIIYPGDNAVGNNGYDVETWNWNYNPGTTTIVLPWDKLHGERHRIDELQQNRFVGSLALRNKGARRGVLQQTWGRYGMFAMDFQEKANVGFGGTYGPNTHNDSFTFKKSNFAFKNYIVSLGSGIANDDAVNPTVTTLYQRLTSSESGVTTVNDTDYTDDGTTIFSGDEDHWVINDYRTGFYIASGSGDLNVWKGTQQTPNENQVWPVDVSLNPVGEYTIGHLDHGTLPDNRGYEYVIVPNANPRKMRKLSHEKPYVVYERSAARHVVNEVEDAVWGYALFEAAADMAYPGSVLKASDTSCLVMYKEVNEEKIRLSVVDPDIGFTSRGLEAPGPRKVQLTLHGNWSLAKSHPRATLVSADNIESVFEFDIVDGLPVEIKLKQEEDD